MNISRLDAVDQFIGTEGAFAGSTPDVNPFGIQDKDICVKIVEGRTQRIDTQRIVGRYQYWRCKCRAAQCLQSGLDAMPAPVDCPARQEMIQIIGKR